MWPFQRHQILNVFELQFNGLIQNILHQLNCMWWPIQLHFFNAAFLIYVEHLFGWQTIFNTTRVYSFRIHLHALECTWQFLNIACIHYHWMAIIDEPNAKKVITFFLFNRGTYILMPIRYEHSHHFKYSNLFFTIFAFLDALPCNFFDFSFKCVQFFIVTFGKMQKKENKKKNTINLYLLCAPKKTTIVIGHFYLIKNWKGKNLI